MNIQQKGPDCVTRRGSDGASPYQTSELLQPIALFLSATTSWANSRFAMVDAGLLFAIIYFGCFGLCDVMVAAETDSSRPYAKVCISVRGEKEASEVPFTTAMEPGPGKSIVAHAVANVPCVLLVAAFLRADGQLADDWRPQCSEMEEQWEEVTLPENKAGWRWEAKIEPFDFYVLVSPAGLAIVQEIKQLVAAMQNLKEGAVILKLQTNKLRELISRAAGDSDPSKHRATATVTEIHGITRGQSEFLWRSFASKVYFDNRNSGLLVFPSGI